MLPIRKHLAELNRTKNPSASRIGFLRLDKNESALELPEEIVAEFRKAITPELLMIYPELDALTRKLASTLKCRPENLFLASGSDPAIKALFEVFVGPGDAVVLPAPTYQMMVVYAKMFQAKLHEVHFKPGVKLAMEDFLRAVVDSRARLVCLANPNSPTGTVFPREEILELVKTADKQGTAILIDEAYYHFYPETVVNAIDKYPHLAVTRTFSKAVGLAAVRMGFVAAHPDMIFALNKVRPMYEANGLAAKFSEIMLDHMDAVKRNVDAMLEGKRFLQRELDAMGLKHHPTYANFLLVEVGSREKSREIVERLKAKKILISGDMAHPALANCVRIGLGNAKQMQRFVKEFKAIWDGSPLPTR